MSKYKIEINGVLTDVCDCKYKVYNGTTFHQIANGDKFWNGTAWEEIVCDLCVNDTTAIYLEVAESPNIADINYGVALTFRFPDKMDYSDYNIIARRTPQVQGATPILLSRIDNLVDPNTNPNINNGEPYTRLEFEMPTGSTPNLVEIIVNPLLNSGLDCTSYTFSSIVNSNNGSGIGGIGGSF